MGMTLLKRLEASMHNKTCILRSCPSVLVCHLRPIIVCPSCHYLLTSLVRLTFGTQIDIVMIKVWIIMVLLLLLMLLLLLVMVMVMMVMVMVVMVMMMMVAMMKLPQFTRLSSSLKQWV